MTTLVDQQIVPHQPLSLPELQAADRGVAQFLESVLSDNTRRTYDTQWRIFQGWCEEVGLRPLPAEPLTVARYLAARANSGASIATLRLAGALTAVQPRKRGLETPAQAAERAEFDLALVAVLSDAGLRRSEASALAGAWDTAAGSRRPPLMNGASRCALPARTAGGRVGDRREHERRCVDVIHAATSKMF